MTDHVVAARAPDAGEDFVARSGKFSPCRCGTVVNPDTVRAQVESAIMFGTTAALHGEITLRNGSVEQTNFRDYLILRLTEME